MAEHKKYPFMDKKISCFANSANVIADQCDQIGSHFQVTNDLSKVAQMFGDFWGILKTSRFK